MIIKKRTVLFFSRSCGTFFDCFECSLPYCMCAICSVSFFTRAPFVPHKMPVAVLVARDWCVMNSLVRDRKARCQCSDVQDFPAFLLADAVIEPQLDAQFWAGWRGHLRHFGRISSRKRSNSMPFSSPFAGSPGTPTVSPQRFSEMVSNISF